MDWRNRKYYTARFASDSYYMRINILKNIDGVRLHSLIRGDYNARFMDELEPRGYYQLLIGCKSDISEIVEYELSKAVRRDGAYTSWKEIKPVNKISN